jgi:sugar lactone lactonase YvrE
MMASSLRTLALALLACSCVDGAADEPALDIDKDQAEALVSEGKADWGFDVCRVMGWYDDGDCDRFCSTIDNDCKLPRPAGFDLQDDYALPGAKLYPESVGFDEGRGEFFHSSLSSNSVTRLGKDGRSQVIFPGTGEAKRFTLGVKTDAPRNRVVVCSYLNESPQTGRVWLFDMTSGARTHDIDLTSAYAGATCNDVLVESSGDILVTDREHPNVYRVHPRTDGGGDVAIWATSPELAKPTIGIGQNGIAMSADGTAVLVTVYLPAKLVRISTRDPRDVRKVELHGQHPLPQFLAGADGMVRLGNAMYVTFGSSLLRLQSDDGWLSARMDRFETGAKLAAVTVARGQLYLLRSDIPSFVLGTNPGPFSLTRFDPRMFDVE